MAVIRAPFRFAGGDGHRRCLRATISEHDLEPESEPQERFAHQRFFRAAAPFLPRAVRVRFGRFAMVRLRRAAAAAFLMFRFAAER